MKPLSTMQHKVYERLRAFKERHGDLPDLASLARELGIHYVSLKQHLQALDKKGYLHFQSRGRGQSPLLDLPLTATGVPVLGDIPAGPLSEAIALAEGYIPLAGSSREDYFALRVSGDSMADLIQNGDVVLFKKGQPSRSGEICAVRLENEVTLKYLEWQDTEHYILRPHNPGYPTVSVTASELQIDGIYQGLLRGIFVGTLVEEELMN